MNQAVSRIGILGVGHLISYLVPAMMRSSKLRDSKAPDFLLSPRNQHHAQTLAKNHGLEIAASNTVLVESCDVVIISVRPVQIATALENLPWRPNQTLISLCAGVSTDEISSFTNGATISRALPVTAALHSESPTSIYPDCAITKDLFASCGPVIVLENEDQFETASMFGAYCGWVQHLIGEMADWAETHDLAPETARLLACQMTRAAATIVRETPEKPIAELVEELCLPGSITGLGLESLKSQDAFTAWHHTGDTVLQRLKGR